MLRFGLGLVAMLASSVPAAAQKPATPYIATIRPLRPEAAPTEYGFAVGNLAIRRLAPVLYTGTAGGGMNEYRVSPNGIEVTIEIADPPANGELADVRWEPYDNLGALVAFAMVRVDRVDRTHVRLSARSYQDTPARMRILITAVYGAE